MIVIGSAQLYKAQICYKNVLIYLSQRESVMSWWRIWFVIMDVKGSNFSLWYIIFASYYMFNGLGYLQPMTYMTYLPTYLHIHIFNLVISNLFAWTTYCLGHQSWCTYVLLTYLWGGGKNIAKKCPKIIDHDYCFWSSINELGEVGDYIYI